MRFRIGDIYKIKEESRQPLDCDAHFLLIEIINHGEIAPVYKFLVVKEDNEFPEDPHPQIGDIYDFNLSDILFDFLKIN